MVQQPQQHSAAQPGAAAEASQPQPSGAAPGPGRAAEGRHGSDIVLRAEHLTDAGLDTIPRPFWRSWAASFEAAIAGVLRTVATQRNMKVHTTSALMVMLVGMALPLDLATRAALIFAIAMVMFAEIFNTALEAVVDLFIGTYHRLAMLAKDAAAAGVLVLAVAAVVVFADIIIANWEMVAANPGRVWRYAAIGGPAVLCQIAILFGPRKGWLPRLTMLLGLGCLAPLVAWSLDPLFSAGALLVYLSSWLARTRFPARMPHGAP